MDWAFIVVSVVTHFLAGLWGYAVGRKAERREKAQAKADAAKMLQTTYANGTRVGKRQMLDYLVEHGFLHEETAAAISEDI